MPTLIDSMLIPKEYIAKEPITATEFRFRLDEFERYPAMQRIRQGIKNTIEELFERVYRTPIQFRFPRSKKKRIRKKWRKDPGNFRKWLDTNQLEDIQIVASDMNVLREV